MTANMSIFGRGKFGIQPTGSTEAPAFWFMPETGSAVVLAKPRSDINTLRGYEVVPQNTRRFYWPPWLPFLGRVYVGSVGVNSHFEQFASSLCNTFDAQRIYAECRVEWQVNQPAIFLVRTRGISFYNAMLQIFSSAVQRFSSEHTSEELITMPYQDWVGRQWRTVYNNIAVNQPTAMNRFPRDIQQRALQQLDTLLANTPRMNSLESLAQQCWNDFDSQLGANFGVSFRQTHIQNISAPAMEELIRGQRALEIRQQIALAQFDALSQQLQRFQNTDWVAAATMLIEHIFLTVSTHLPNLNFGGQTNPPNRP